MEMGLPGHVADDAGDLAKDVVAADLKCSADDVGTVEVAHGGIFVNHYRIRGVEGGVWVAGDHRQGEDFKDRRVGKDLVMIQDMVIAFFYEDVAGVTKPDHLLDLRVGSHQGGAKELRGLGGGERRIVEVDIRGDAVDPVGFVVVAVIAPFVDDIKDNQEADAETGGEANDI